jgi:coenzyme F420 hydrogenase subunit delta
MNQLAEYCRKEIFIAGVGNKLFGDDGFGPEVIDYLENNYDIPENVCLADVGTGLRKILFTITISDIRPEVIVIIDAVDKGRKPGEIFDITLEEIPEIKIDDFSMHQAPTSNMLKELKDIGSVKIIIKACQIESIPEEMQSGLSVPMKEAVPLMAQNIAEEFF